MLAHTHTHTHTHIPVQFLKATDKKTVAAVQNVQLIEKHNVSFLDEEKDALKRYIHASTPLCKDILFIENGRVKTTKVVENGIEVEKWAQLPVKLYHYLTVFCGFNLKKDDAIMVQVQAVITQTGKAYPDFAIYEIFDAIDFCLSKNPELCKSYDSKDGQSSFTAVWLCKIVNYYCTYATSARQIVGRLLAPIEKQLSEKEAIQKRNLETIKFYRNLACMVLQNIGEYLYFGRFKINFTDFDYGEILYKNMQQVGFLQDSQYYKDIWAKHNPEKIVKYTKAMKFGFLKEVITNEIEKYRPIDKEFYATNVLYLIFMQSEWISQETKGISVTKKSLKKKKQPAHSEIIKTGKLDSVFSLQNPIWGLAVKFGFLQNVKLDDFDLSTEMSITEILQKYGNKVVSLYPLLFEEMIIRDFDSQSAFSNFNKIL